MFVSFNDGDDWQSLDLNLPPVPITDLKIRQDNLVAATQGRGFWVLDDLFVIRQAAAEAAEKDLHVYAPGRTYMMGSAGSGTFEAKNPASGVALYYHIKDDSEEPLSIAILNSAGEVIRNYSSEESDHDRCRISNMDPRRPFEIKYPGVGQGLNVWRWDMRAESVVCIPDIALFAGFGGPTVAPGDYSARLTVGDAVDTVQFTIELDPRLTASDADIAIWVARLAEVKEMLSASLNGLNDLRVSRSEIEALQAQFPDDAELQRLGSAANDAIGQWEEKITQLKHQTYEDEDAWETMLAGQIRYLLNVIDRTGPPVTDGAMTRMQDLRAEWQARESELRSISNDLIQPINAWAQANQVSHVQLPE